MTGVERIAIDQHEQNVASLVGRRLKEVRYYPLTSGDGGSVESWDFDDWHQATMGVELRDTQDRVLSVIWGQAFGGDQATTSDFGLELRVGSIDDHLIPEARRPVEATSLARWSSFIGVSLGVSTVWSAGTGPESVPVALRLTAGTNVLWIAAACPRTWPTSDEFVVGADEVMVIFSEDLAQSLGLSGSAR